MSSAPFLYLVSMSGAGIDRKVREAENIDRVIYYVWNLRCLRVEAREATDQELLTFHTRDLIREVESSRNLTVEEQEELCRLVTNILYTASYQRKYNFHVDIF